MNRFNKINVIPILFMVHVILNIIDYPVIGILITTIYFICIGFKNLKALILCISRHKKMLSIWGIALAFNSINYFSKGEISLLIKYNLDLLYLLILVIMAILIYTIKGMEYIENGLIKIKNLIVISGIIGIYEFIMRKNPLLEYFKYDYISMYSYSDYRTASIYVHPIFYAYILIFGLTIILYCDKSKYKIIELIIVLLSIYTTKTRSVWLLTVIVIVFWILKTVNIKLNYKRLKYIYIGILGICIFLNSSLAQDMFISIKERLIMSGESVSYTQRMGTVEYIFKFFFSNKNNIANFISGYGSESVHEAMAKTIISISGFTTTDNQWVSLLYNFGIILFTIVLVFAISVGVKIIYSKRKEVVFFGNIVMIFFVAMFFFEVLGNHMIIMVMFFSLGLYLKCLEE